MDVKLSKAESVLLSILDGVEDNDLEGYEWEIDFIIKLRSCTRWSNYHNSFIKKDNYDTVMGGSQ